MKMQIMAKFIDDKGNEIIKPVELETDVPDFDDFHDASDFLQVFDRYEKAAIKLRNETSATASKAYLDMLSKKNSQ